MTAGPWAASTTCTGSSRRRRSACPCQSRCCAAPSGLSSRSGPWRPRIASGPKRRSRAMTLDGIEVSHDEVAQRYEARVDGALSLIEYERQGDRIIYLHTEVPRALEGRGIAATLARTALEDARARNLSVVPLCPFVSGYIRRHTEYLALVDPAYRARLR